MTITPTQTQINAADLDAGHSVSSGSLREDHLADALLGEIDRLGLSSSVPDDLAAAAQQLATTASDPVAFDLPDTAADTVAELLELLNDAAPDGWALQSLEGDGAELCWQPITLRAQLQAVGHHWADTDCGAVGDLIDKYDDEPDALRNYERSDWVNLDECYTRDLLQRWEQQQDDIKALFDDYCEAIGATSTLQALEGQTIDDPDDMAAAMVNLAMTWAALQILSALEDL